MTVSGKLGGLMRHLKLVAGLALLLWVAACGANSDVANRVPAGNGASNAPPAANAEKPAVGGQRLAQEQMDFLRGAESLMLYSVTPKALPKGRGQSLAELEAGEFDGKRAVYGHVSVDASRRGELATLLENALGGFTVDCFDPRHVIVAAKGQESRLFSICFECSKIIVFDAEGRELDRSEMGTSAPKLSAFLDTLLKDGGVTLAHDVKDALPD